ncbi:hypothetical protein Bca4012_025457 [Brassica carinata]|uniref:Uncharacterized protein n=1 Tax=Brassica carinata TaxID=52824 RepID=A0A8X8ARF5_BRACI|nr:hypothetical protein Bca52824_022516 [Brassica carinata]
MSDLGLVPSPPSSPIRQPSPPYLRPLRLLLVTTVPLHLVSSCRLFVGDGKDNKLVISSESIIYGLQNVVTENDFEKKLISDVIPPSDIGEQGMVDEAQKALEEAEALKKKADLHEKSGTSEGLDIHVARGMEDNYHHDEAPAFITALP